MSVESNSILAVIPARGGSKGLPRKNVLPLAGKPLIAWSIELALMADAISRVVVTTDDAEIAQVARDYGAEVPFIRPPELASDQASGTDVLIHALRESERIYNEEYKWVLLLQPTSPLRSLEDIQDAIHLSLDDQVDAVIGIKEVSEFPQWMKRQNQNGDIVDYLDGVAKVANRQELDVPYIVNGAIYLIRASMLKESGDFYSGVTKGFRMPKDRSVDIDDELDFMMAELLLEKGKR